MEKTNKRLKILMLTEDFVPILGGVTSVVEKSSLALSQYADVTIGTVQVDKKLDKSFKEPNAPYKVIRSKGFYNIITTNMQSNLDKKFKKEIENTKYDIIHCHFPFGGLYKYGLQLGKKTHTPVVVTAHSILTPDIKDVVKSTSLSDAITKIIVNRLNKADNIFCVSKFCKNHLLKYGLNPSAKIVYNGVEMEDNNTDKSLNFKKRYKLNSKTFTVAVVGRLVKMKNVKTLVQAMAFLKDQKLNLKLLIIGHGPEKKSLQKLIDNSELNGSCIIDENVTTREMLAEIYSDCNLIAFPSYGDSAGLIHIEAAYYSKPTLAIENTAISEKIIDKQNGFIAKNCPEDIADKILYAYNHKTELLKMGQSAKTSLYRSYFDENVIKELLGNYMTTIKNYQSKPLALKIKKPKKSTKIKLVKI